MIAGILKIRREKFEDAITGQARGASRGALFSTSHDCCNGDFGLKIEGF